jgi:hypothetical protein
MTGVARFNAALLMARVGYQWFPTRHGFYVMPWLGLGASAALSGERTVGGERYNVSPVIAFATLHTGWRF